jgi:hypothetical protein
LQTGPAGGPSTRYPHTPPGLPVWDAFTDLLLLLTFHKPIDGQVAGDGWNSTLLEQTVPSSIIP